MKTGLNKNCYRNIQKALEDLNMEPWKDCASSFKTYQMPRDEWALPTTLDVYKAASLSLLLSSCTPHFSLRSPNHGAGNYIVLLVPASSHINIHGLFMCSTLLPKSSQTCHVPAGKIRNLCPLKMVRLDKMSFSPHLCFLLSQSLKLLHQNHYVKRKGSCSKHMEGQSMWSLLSHHSTIERTHLSLLFPRLSAHPKIILLKRRRTTIMAVV